MESSTGRHLSSISRSSLSDVSAVDSDAAKAAPSLLSLRPRGSGDSEDRREILRII